MSWEIRYIVSLQHQRTNNLGHKHKGDKWLISSILPGSLGREAQKSVDVKALKFYFHQKEVHEQVLMVILAMVLCYVFFYLYQTIRYNVKQVKAIVRSLYNSILHLSSVKADSVEQSYTAPETRDYDSVSGSKNTENANATKKYAYLILQILLFS